MHFYNNIKCQKKICIEEKGTSERLLLEQVISGMINSIELNMAVNTWRDTRVKK